VNKLAQTRSLGHHKTFGIVTKFAGEVETSSLGKGQSAKKDVQQPEINVLKPRLQALSSNPLAQSSDQFTPSVLKPAKKIN